METRLIYNATERLYEVRLGIRVLSSYDTKEQALIAQLSGEVPAAMEIAQKLIKAYPDLQGRAIKAVALLAQGAVEATEHANLFNVRSQEKPGKKPKEVYLVDVSASTCTCLDWERNAPLLNGRKVCKHVLAALYLRRVGIRPSGIPVRTERLCHEKRP